MIEKRRLDFYERKIKLLEYIFLSNRPEDFVTNFLGDRRSCILEKLAVIILLCSAVLIDLLCFDLGHFFG